MLFNSYIFIFLFLPLCLVGFYILQNRQATLTKVWLTCFSLWFYGYFNLYYLGIMVCSILGNYGIHCIMVKKSRGKEKKGAKRVLAAGVVLNLLVLFYFKYYDFFLENVNALFGSSFALKNILLPLGISFFTFQQISFLVDTYRGDMNAAVGEKTQEGERSKKRVSFWDYALFVSFFPQLIAGPIVVWEEMYPQFARFGKDTRSREERLEIFVKGVYVFVLGLAKKVLIADTFAAAVDYAYGNVGALNGLESFLTILFYSLQLYFDFSGYCDMAKGIAGLFGMEIANNFDSPYKAVNIVDFWKRWHITLSRFFTKNIYIPLGGNRKGEKRMYLNFLLVFFLSGLWHGAGWNFLLWGMMHGVLYVATKWWRLHRKGRHWWKEEPSFSLEKASLSHKLWNLAGRTVSRLLTFSYVSVAWVYFRAETVEQANHLLGNVLNREWTWPGTGLTDAFQLGEFWYLLKILRVTALPHSEVYLLVLFTAVVLGITFFGKNVDALAKGFQPKMGYAVLTAILFVWCTVSLSGVSSFLYFNF